MEKIQWLVLNSFLALVSDENQPRRHTAEYRQDRSGVTMTNVLPSLTSVSTTRYTQFPSCPFQTCFVALTSP